MNEYKGKHRRGMHLGKPRLTEYRAAPANVCYGRHCLGVAHAVQHRHEYMPRHIYLRGGR